MEFSDQDNQAFFEELSQLYFQDPEQFEQRRKALIEETIQTFPEDFQKRAQGLQFTIEARLQAYHDPIMRMNKMVEIFWEHFASFQEVVNNPEKVMRERQNARQEATILPFQRPRH